MQEHIGEVTKLYNNLILRHNISTLSSQRPPLAPSECSVTTRSTSSQPLLTIQYLQNDSNDSPTLSQLIAQGLCILIAEAAPPLHPLGLTINRATSDISGIANPPDHQPIVHFPNPNRRIAADESHDNCSAIARHLFAHVKDHRFDTKAEVAEWCQKNVLIDIIWRSSTLGLSKRRGKNSFGYAQQSAKSSARTSLVLLAGERRF